MPEMLWKGYIDFEIERSGGCMPENYTNVYGEDRACCLDLVRPFEGTEIGSGPKPHEMFSRRACQLKTTRELE
jgi:hypothetical protein